MKDLVEILKEISRGGIQERVIIVLDEERSELGEFIEKYTKEYLRKLNAREVSHNDLFMQWEIKVKEKNNERK